MFIEHVEGGKVWVVKVSDDAPEGFEEIALAYLKEYAKFELYERQKIEKRNIAINKVIADLKSIEHDLLAEAEAIVRYPLPELKTYTLIAAGYSSISNFPLFNGMEREVVYQLRRELPENLRKKYTEAKEKLNRL
jgi:hypothetical protein